MDFDFSHALGGERAIDSVAEIVGIGLVVDMLELTPATLGEVAARWNGSVRPGLDPPVLEETISRCSERDEPPGLCDAIAASRESNDRLALAHSEPRIASRR